jgi:hypothetical protein
LTLDQLVVQLREDGFDFVEGQHLEFGNSTGEGLANEVEEDRAEFFLADVVNNDLLVLEQQVDGLSREFSLLTELDDGGPHSLSELGTGYCILGVELADHNWNYVH